MTPTLRSGFSRMPGKQSGVTLLVAIIFLLVITVLGISSMRGVSLESRITGNLRQQKILTSAAEAGLRIAEAQLQIAARGANFDVVQGCSPTICMPYSLAQLASTLATSSNQDTPARFLVADDANVARVLTGYDTKIQWYLVRLGTLGLLSVGSGALTTAGVQYYEINSCASTVWCTSSDTTTQRVILRTVFSISK